MQLIIASNNAHKLQEIRAILGGVFAPILSLKELGIRHETVEDGKTFAQNACKKAREIAALTGQWALADDSGLCVDALEGAPGVYSARFCGRHGDDAANNRLLLQKLQGVQQRGARFVCAVALAGPQGQCLCAEGALAGQIATEAAGENGFGYDPLFYLPEYGCTAAQLPAQQKNRISHRAAALQALLQALPPQGPQGLPCPPPAGAVPTDSGTQATDQR